MSDVIPKTNFHFVKYFSDFLVYEYKYKYNLLSFKSTTAQLL